MKYVNVIVDNKSEYTDSFYTYSAPDDTEIGDKVTISFARRKKPIDGYVFEADVEPAIDPGRIKPVASVDKRRSLSAEMVDTAKWMVRRYGFKAIDAIKMFTVSGKRESSEKILKVNERKYPEYELTVDQISALERINSAIDKRVNRSFLLKGVTNSGKTEVYMHAVEAVLAQGRTAIVLVPEIALAAQTERRFKDRFGDKAVAVMHSKLSTSKRLEEWLRIRDGEARIVIGARTAVFAPLDDIGIIVIDEEHESTYKSDHNPKYETVDIAFKRAKTHEAVLLLGSATPSVVSYSRVEEGIYELLEMNQRVGASEMPDIEIADMREETRAGNLGMFSRKLCEEIGRTLDNREQVILFLNRRGYSTQVLCPDCGFRLMCEDCGISMTYHKTENAGICHYCGRKKPIPAKCPSCGYKKLTYIGTGTEKVQENISELFPDASVDRFDLDTAKDQREIDKTISGFTTGKTDILVGTQILAKGLDFQNVGLVGIVLADTSLNIPDYRSGERTYQLITQVAGRAGRNSDKSKVVIQTYQPEDDIINSAAIYDYEGFYKGELLHRRMLKYPPFTDIILVTFTDKKDSENDPELVMRYAWDFRKKLLAMRDAPEDAEIYEPREEFIKIGHDRNRVSFVIKAPRGSRSGYIKAYQAYKERMIQDRSPCFIEIDVNPYGIV